MMPTTRRRALIVATGKYDDHRLRRLRAPAADAEELAAVLRDPAIGDFDVEIARDCDDRELRRRIARFFQHGTRDDVLLMHISGHGIKDARGALYLAASDTELDLLDATAISASWLDEQMTQSMSRRKLMLLDCCFSGKFPFNTTARAGDGVDVQERLQGRGRAVITASSSMEYAYEGDQLSGEGRPSYFTAAVVEALRTGEADRDQDRWISVDELYDYVFERVKEQTPDQTPNKQSALEGPLYVARSRYMRPVEPAKLDPQLLDLLEHPYSGARLGAVEELATLLTATNQGIALAARQALETLRDDDSHRVRSRVQAVLGAGTTSNETASLSDASASEAPTRDPGAVPADKPDRLQQEANTDDERRESAPHQSLADDRNQQAVGAPSDLPDRAASWPREHPSRRRPRFRTTPGAGISLAAKPRAEVLTKPAPAQTASGVPSPKLRETTGLRSKRATASLWLGIIALLLPIWGLLAGPAAIVLGRKARKQMRLTDGPRGTRLAAWGIALGWIATVGWGLIVVLLLIFDT